jgi:hypothetical protein
VVRDLKKKGGGADSKGMHYNKEMNDSIFIKFSVFSLGYKE